MSEINIWHRKPLAVVNLSGEGANRNMGGKSLRRMPSPLLKNYAPERDAEVAALEAKKKALRAEVEAAGAELRRIRAEVGGYEKLRSENRVLRKRAAKMESAVSWFQAAKLGPLDEALRDLQAVRAERACLRHKPGAQPDSALLSPRLSASLQQVISSPFSPVSPLSTDCDSSI
ncbi:hypothetical protein DIPPA_32354 [Diplonema papillatum]|nr:hypothetical protein DIPPA_32354 [Diplonema papillatum]